MDYTNVREGQDFEVCRTHKIMNEKLLNPVFLKMYAADQALIQKRKEEMLHEKKQGTVYTFPVVFHVLHNGGNENVTREELVNAVDILNTNYRRLNASANTVEASFQGLPADIEIEFVLATKAPNGACFSGITRTQSPTSFLGDDGGNQLDAIRNGNDVYQGEWPGNEYLNFYIVGDAGGAGGYTTKPAFWSQYSMGNGIWVLYTQIGNTVTHEVGHWLNLSHTWGNSNSPALASNCGIDDGISDTPNTLGVTSCILTENSCGPTANVENYMDYALCYKMFTPGQAVEMRAAATSSIRSNHWSTSNLNAVGGLVNPPFCNADFYTNRVIICQGETIDFTDNSHNGTVNSWNWTFTGGSPSSATIQNPSITYNTPGTYAVTLQASDGSTTLTETKNAYITVGSPSSSSIAQTVCNSQTPYTAPSGIVYTSNGIYSDTIPNSFGCDSIITIDLTFSDLSTSTITQAACGSYTLNGQTYTSSGFYTQTLTNVAGCDSTITLNLTVNPNQFSPDFSVNQTLFTAPPFAAQFTNTTPNAIQL